MNGEWVLNETAARAVWALAIIAGGLAAYWLYNRILFARAERANAISQKDDSGHLVPGAKPGTPAILYFTTPDCVPCRTVQKPALQKVKERLGDQLQVIEVNALEQPEMAGRWGVLSVPTTFILDEGGKLKHINHGVTRAEKLIEQLNP
jgi:thiol-disulfide isomerase/thioredoxin